MQNILEAIAAKTRERVKFYKQHTSLDKVIAQAQELAREDKIFKFENALRLEHNAIAFICECKRASPSKGVIAENFNYLEIASDYEAAGADAVSVLTEPEYFLGHDEYLRDIAAQIKIPCLRKDFIIDEYMIYQAKILGAECVLLISALLDAKALASYIKICDALNLSALVEAHDEREIKIALDAGAKIIGVNNRNLKDFKVDINNSERLRKLVPDNILFIAESGIKTPEDIKRLRDCGVNAVLIGETLMKAENKRAMLASLRGN